MTQLEPDSSAASFLHSCLDSSRSHTQSRLLQAIMSNRLPVLQYDEGALRMRTSLPSICCCCHPTTKPVMLPPPCSADECLDNISAADIITEHTGSHAEQPRQAPKAASRSSSSKVGPKGSSSSRSKAAAKQQQQQQHKEERSDVSAARPDVLQALSKERKRRAFIGMLK